MASVLDNNSSSGIYVDHREIIHHLPSEFRSKLKEK